MREYYALKYQSYDSDTQRYMKALSCEHVDEHYKAMDDGVKIIIRRDTRYYLDREI